MLLTGEGIKQVTDKMCYCHLILKYWEKQAALKISLKDTCQGPSFRVILIKFIFIKVGRRTPWNRLVSLNVKNVILETWCLYQISAARGHLSIIKPGFVPIPSAAST
jgi:hypothetical protein